MYYSLLAIAGIASAAPLSSAVSYLGRVNPATNELTWPGTGLRFTFTGTSAEIGLAAINGANSVELTVDGEVTIISNVEGSISTPSLAQGNHSVVLRRRSEALFGTITIGDITGSLGPASDLPRRIEFIGDSITVGYGLDGTNPCTNTAAVENNPKTYGALTADALGADYSMIAWSGIGITRNYASTTPDASPIMPELYTRYGTSDADDSYTFPAEATPDVVVMAHGTNDFGYLDVRDPLDSQVYQDAVVDFVESIQAHYPNAEFFLVSSPMLSDTYPTAEDAQHTTQSNALKAAAEQIGAEAHFVDWPAQGADVGCDYHPNAATHAAGGEILTAAIAEVLGW